MSQNKKLFVGGLAAETDETSLQEFYGAYGTVEDTVVMRDPAGQSRCFGFITFSDPAAAQAAISETPHEIDGKVVDAKPAVPREQHQANQAANIKKVFVGGLRRNVDEDQLREYFGTYGEVTDVVVMIDKMTGNSRGFGFVSFSDSSTVDNVVGSGQHQVGGFPIDVKKALPRDGNNNNRGGGRSYGNDRGMGYGSMQQSYNQGYQQRNQWQQGYDYPPPAQAWNQQNHMPNFGYYPTQGYPSGPVRDSYQHSIAHPYDNGYRR